MILLYPCTEREKRERERKRDRERDRERERKKERERERSYNREKRHEHCNSRTLRLYKLQRERCLWSRGSKTSILHPHSLLSLLLRLILPPPPLLFLLLLHFLAVLPVMLLKLPTEKTIQSNLLVNGVSMSKLIIGKSLYAK